MSQSFKPHFSRFLAAAPERLHFAAHSHHYWPDVTFDAQMECWQDAARLAGGKWDHVLGTVMPEVQRGIARHLGLPDPASLAFAPNTHEFVKRLLSCLPSSLGSSPASGQVPRILTSDGEFHSFTYAGPMFSAPIAITPGEVVERDGFVFADLMADD